MTRYKITLQYDGSNYCGWQLQKSERTVQYFLEKALIKISSFVIYQSNYCKDAADQFLGSAAGKWSICNKCVDIDTFSPIACKKTDTIRLLIAGTHYQRERVWA